MNYEPVIGLEIHAELKCETKLFCGCKNEFGGRANTRVCPVCTGQPGAMPSVNRRATELAIRAGIAFGCEITRLSKQCRKHYFYPDLPKGYQISQNETPLAVNGSFSFLSDGEVKTVGIREIHLEEDAGKLVHTADGKTGIDYNRAGVPLIEIVTLPELHSAKDARAFAESVRMCLLRCGVSDCKMEQGSLRCDVNVSLRPVGDGGLYERVEMKNINTFSGAERAIESEISRQTEILNSGKAVTAETRKWDDEKRESRLMRTKENALDYKFMPEPDIPAYIICEADIKSASKNLPESDVSRVKRYKSLGVGKNDTEKLIFDISLCDFFEAAIKNSENAGECAKLLCGDVSAILSKSGAAIENTKLSPVELANCASLIVSGKINRTSAKKLLERLIKDGGSAKELAKEYECTLTASETERIIEETISNNEKAKKDYLSGNGAALMFLMGQCMRAFRGKADAAAVKKILSEKLEKEKENEI